MGFLYTEKLPSVSWVIFQFYFISILQFCQLKIDKYNNDDSKTGRQSSLNSQGVGSLPCWAWKTQPEPILLVLTG